MPQSIPSQPLEASCLELRLAEALPYRMTEAREIGRVLAELATAGIRLYLYPAEAQAPLCASLCQVEAGRGTLLLDCRAAAPAPLPQRYDSLLCVALLQQVKIQFSLHGVAPLAGGPPSVFSATFPEALLHSQRRAYLRLDAPLGLPYSAEFSWHGESYCANLYDLSLGGVGLRAAPRDVPELLPGQLLPHVQLELGSGRQLSADLEIRLFRRFRSRLLGEQVHIGCRFVALPPAALAALGRIMSELENKR